MNLSDFFAIGLNDRPVLPASYDPVLVTVSFFVAALAGFAFVRLSHRIAERQASPLRPAWTAGGALIMGFGIWSMHFIGMLAYRLPISVAYDPWLTAGSALPAVLASAWSLHLVSRPEVSTIRLLSAGVILGGGVGLMHYTGMAAMEVGALVRYDVPLFLLSLLVAVMFAVAALWIANRMARPGAAPSFAHEGIAALMIGFAVAGMHYTAMSSTLCFAQRYPRSGILNMEPGVLAVATAIVATLILITGIAAVVFDRRLAVEIARRMQAIDRADETDQRLQLVLDNVADALVTFGRDGTIQTVNRAFERVFGYAPQAILGRHVSLLLAETGAGAGRRDLDRILDDHKPQSAGGDSLRFTGRRSDGTEVRLEGVFSNVVEDGRLVIIGALRDVTERERSLQALTRAREMAENASRAKSEFISHMSHELRTPLNAVIGLADALLRVDALRNDQDRLRQYLLDIQASGRHLLDLVNEILDLTVIERGGRTLTVETFDALAEIEDVLRPIRLNIDGRRTRITVLGTANPSLITADRQSFKQVLLNLAGNAIVHGGDDLDLRVEVDASTPDALTCIRIRDNGPGMPQKLIDAIGQPFPQVSDTYIQGGRNSQGKRTGLGLYIVCQLMNLNGGAFKIDSRLGEGTTAATFWPRGTKEGLERAAE